MITINNNNNNTPAVRGQPTQNKIETSFPFLFFVSDFALFYFCSRRDFQLSGGEGHGLLGLATCIYHQLLIAP